jgi:hypothetical protein
MLILSAAELQIRQDEGWSLRRARAIRRTWYGIPDCHVATLPAMNVACVETQCIASLHERRLGAPARNDEAAELAVIAVIAMRLCLGGVMRRDRAILWGGVMEWLTVGASFPGNLSEKFDRWGFLCGRG